MATKTVTKTVEKPSTETVFVTSIKTCPVIPIQTITFTTPAIEFFKESATVTETQTEGFTSTETVISAAPFVQPSFSSFDAVQATIQTITIMTTAKEFCKETATVTETQTEGFTSTETAISAVPFVQPSFSSSDAVQATIQTITIMTTSDAVQATIQTITIMTTAKEFCKETATVTETQTEGFTSTETVISAAPFVQPSFSPSDAVQATIQTITIMTTAKELCKETATVTETQTEGFTSTETVIRAAPIAQPSFSSSDEVQTTTGGKMSRACRDVIVVNATEDVDMTKAVVERIVSRLTVDKKRISAVIQKKISQEDNRPSSVAVGYIGVIFLVLPFVAVLAADLPKMYHDGFTRYRTRTR
ncbi:hypothetical protein SNE40_017596 [Patella caerulea]|uniref:Uncharacterized protein n=1 Tax=Patella caerulea TaxID=87958 RepID=A0AAN8JAP8_PATCE